MSCRWPRGDYETPQDANRDNDYEVTLRATDDDENTATAEVTVSVTDVVEAADFSVTGLSSGTVPENRQYSATAVLDGTPIGDVEWTVEGGDAGAFAIGSATGRLTMAGQDFENPADTGADNGYEVTARATDADQNTASLSITVTVTDVVERSTVRIDGLADDTVAENELWRSPAPSVTGAIGAVTWTREGEDAGHFGIDPVTGVLTLPGQDYESPADRGKDNVYRVTAKVTDADSNQATRSTRVTVIDTVEVSDLTVDGLADASTPENVSWTSSAPTVTGAIGSVTWSKSGTDADDFSIDARIGVLTLAARDYESPSDDNRDNHYEVTVSVTDDDGNRASVLVTITVTDSAETATVRIEGLTDASTPENAAWTSPAPVASGAIGAVSWDKEGPDASLFDIDPSGGILTLGSRNYEAPEDADRNNVYEVTVKATDSDGNADTHNVRVTVSDEREISTVEVGGLIDGQIEENQAWTSAMPFVHGAIGSVTWSRHGDDADDFRIDADTGVLTLPARDYESPADADRDNTYRVTARATDADANDGEQSIEVAVTDVEDSADPTGPGTGTGGGGGGGGGAVNRPPEVEREIPAQTLDVGETAVLDIRLSFYDRDQRSLAYSVTSADPSVASAETDDREQTLTVRGVGRGRTWLTVSAADRREETASQTVPVTVLGPALLAYVPSASDPALEGFLRVVNRAGEDAEITVEATDDAGMTADPVTLSLEAGGDGAFQLDRPGGRQCGQGPSPWCRLGRGRLAARARCGNGF